MRQWLPLRVLFIGPGQSRLDQTRDVLAGFRLAVGPREGSAFKRIMRPQGVALPILGCAAWVRLDESGERFADLRICIGPVAKVPARAEAVEEALRGAAVGADAVERAVTVARETLRPRTSKYRATAEYRREMISAAAPLLPGRRRARTSEAIPEGGME